MTEKTFSKIEEELRPHVIQVAHDSMKQARLEEVAHARATNNLDKDGRPQCTVISDGQWSQRSYGSNYRAKSGSVCVIRIDNTKV